MFFSIIISDVYDLVKDIFSGKKDEPENTVDAIRGTITGKHAPED